jgi:hypothetical protein
MVARLAVWVLAVVLTSLLATLSATACDTQSDNQSAQNGSEHPQAEPPTGGEAQKTSSVLDSMIPHASTIGGYP